MDWLDIAAAVMIVAVLGGVIAVGRRFFSSSDRHEDPEGPRRGKRREAPSSEIRRRPEQRIAPRRPSYPSADQDLLRGTKAR